MHRCSDQEFGSTWLQHTNFVQWQHIPNVSSSKSRPRIGSWGFLIAGMALYNAHVFRDVTSATESFNLPRPSLGHSRIWGPRFVDYNAASLRNWFPTFRGNSKFIFKVPAVENQLPSDVGSSQKMEPSTTPPWKLNTCSPAFDSKLDCSWYSVAV